MNNKNISNPIYKKLFPETYAKNIKLNKVSSSISNDYRYTPRIKSSVEEQKVDI